MALSKNWIKCLSFYNNNYLLSQEQSRFLYKKTNQILSLSRFRKRANLDYWNFSNARQWWSFLRKIDYIDLERYRLDFLWFNHISNKIYFFYFILSIFLYKMSYRYNNYETIDRVNELWKTGTRSNG